MPSKKKNKMPAILFYTGDWLKDPAVRCCSLAARGLWIDMLCLMYESPIRGHLSLANGDAVSGVQLARMVGSTLPEIATLLEELHACGVYDIDSSGVIISRRMVSDELERGTKSRAGKKGMLSRYSKTAGVITEGVTEVQNKSNSGANKDVTALEIEYEVELESEVTHNSSSNYVLARKSREANEHIDRVVDSIPKNRLDNPSRTRAAILEVLECAVKNGKSVEIASELLAERFKAYFESEQGRGKFYKSPHNWLAEKCHLADPSVWESRKEPQKPSGWDSVEIE